MNVDWITLNSLVLCIPLRLVVLYPLGEAGENKNKCQVPGGRELGSGRAQHCLVGEGLGAKELRMGGRGDGMDGDGLPAFLTHWLRQRYLLGEVLVFHCLGGEEKGQSWRGPAHALFGRVGKEWKDVDELFRNDEVRETWGPQLNWARLEVIGRCLIIIWGAFSTLRPVLSQQIPTLFFSCKLTREVEIINAKSVSVCTFGRPLDSISPREETVSLLTFDCQKRASTILLPQESNYFSHSNFPLKTGLHQPWGTILTHDRLCKYHSRYIIQHHHNEECSRVTFCWSERENHETIVYGCVALSVAILGLAYGGVPFAYTKASPVPIFHFTLPKIVW